MALISADALAGYLLEEAIAFLLSSNGYRLLQDSDADEQALRQAGHGLLVRGRGADHQADVLGDLMMPTPFSLPVRLFVEAKNRRSKVGLAEVRNAHGVIDDVNQQYSTELSTSYRHPLRRYQYRYALFSAAGFKKEAQSYALAQQISLVDLSGPAFEPLITTVERAARVVLAEAVDAALTTFPVRQVRLALRTAFSSAGAEMTATGVPSEDTDGGLPTDVLASWAARVTAELQDSATGEGLILGFPAAPFILAMHPDSMEDFEVFIAEHGTNIPVDIRFGREGARGDWAITPTADPEAFRLSFGLPGALEAWLLSAPEQERRRAADAKQLLLPTISLFLEDRLVQLRYQPMLAPPRPPSDDEQAEGGAGTDAADTSFLRRNLPARPRQRERPEVRIVLEDQVERVSREIRGWSVWAAEKLMTVLDNSYPMRAALIRTAARQHGRLEREQVYAIAEFPPDRTLRGLTRPTNRITASLIEQGRLPEEVEYPFQTGYDLGVKATHFTVPPDLVAALRALGPPRGI
ncbi:restriction endonuclease [Micromonospora peucetia]|uniref:Restriction endonuclease n=1 Tax=Micromonospora peucetia TaxID=47871 RepID=A0ABZ1E8D9_9ACTN|nr:restriction endonuclease [Micromonospora peucetia]MCX4388245.1 restriction endonuclease [Micromonospora peucetia]WSA31075.1 restriction endonuclease [Micromonospora peucetia]